MSLRGQCACGNITLHWQLVDYSLVPRACQCDYCAGHGAAWVSKAGTRVKVRVRRPTLHRTVSHGSGQARFHECSHCNTPVCVTADIDGTPYGVLNARCLHNPRGFAEAVATDFSAQDGEQKRARWAQNWCSPVTLESG